MTTSGLLHWLSSQLISHGPGLLFVVCLLETAVFAGLILPVGALIAFAAMISARGVLDPVEVVTAALTGAMLGDQVGFVVGRWFIAGASPPRGNVARIWRAALGRTEGLIRVRGGIGVSLGRAIPFVRTVMPWFAGRSGMHWGRFLVFDVLGLCLWGAIYVGGGYVTGEGWRQVASHFGEIAGAIVATIALVTIFIVAVPRWMRRAG